MRRPSPAVVVALLALFVALSAGAYAVTKAPKNSVVSKSIKNGQVKARDLGTATTIQAVNMDGLPITPSSTDVRRPIGYSDGTGPVALHTPVDAVLSDFMAVTTGLGAGESRRFDIERAATIGGNSTVVVSCTVQPQTTTCRRQRGGTIPAGHNYTVRIVNGPGGANSPSSWIAYTLKPK